jgi:VWFA-related protein
MLNLMPRAAATAVLVTAVVTQAVGYSQDNAAMPTQTLKVTTRIVVLDVVVTDKKGNLVPRELTRDDFTVREDGQQQVIRSFEPPSEHHMPVSDKAVVNSAADLTKIGDVSVTVLVLDELNSRFEDMSFSRQMMVKHLGAQPAVLKEPAVLMVATNDSFQQRWWRR